MIYVISQADAPPLGDLRAANEHADIYVAADAVARADWSRYADAAMIALTRGARIHRLGEDFS